MTSDPSYRRQWITSTIQIIQTHHLLLYLCPPNQGCYRCLGFLACRWDWYSIRVLDLDVGLAVRVDPHPPHQNATSHSTQAPTTHICQYHLGLWLGRCSRRCLPTKEHNYRSQQASEVYHIWHVQFPSPIESRQIPFFYC